ncbi:MAG: type II toxin-antitoxin system RelE/ParE family toxin [Deltaproteobacteria bacterium]|nr:type II toxin-antitoxin system RelE/ParE family toxin [Deltaproteobacteria bacterium]
MEIVILKQAKRELRDATPNVIQDVFALFDDLVAGKMLSMPISRPLPSIARGLHELRLSGERGEYRVFYVIRVGDAIYVIHATEKKKNELDRKTAELLKTRIRSLGL